jgi:hypothetical protein
MTVKNMVGFASWDRANPDHINQIEQLPGIVESELRTLTGVTDLTVRAIGNFTTSKRGEALAASKIQVRIPNVSGGADEDRARGSVVGLTATSNSFINLVLSQLSSLISLNWSLEKALVQEPPGLVVTTGAAPALAATEVASPYPPQRIFQLSLTGDLADTASAQTIATITPFQSWAGWGTTFWITPPNKSTTLFQQPHVKLAGKWALDATFDAKDSGGTHPVVSNLEAYPIATTRTIDGGAFSNPFEQNYGAQDAVYYMGQNFAVNAPQGYGGGTVSVQPIIYGIDNALTTIAPSYWAFDENPLVAPIPADGMSDNPVTIVLTNTTGSPISNGTHVADLVVTSDVIVSSATS